MDIIFIASLKSYTTAVSLIKSFKNNNDVMVLSDVNTEYVNIDEIVEQNFNIFQYIVDKNLRPDLVFFCEGGSMKLFPQGLELLNCKTAWYAIDTHMDLLKHLTISNFFDFTFLAQKEYINIFKEKGFFNSCWLPLGYDKTMKPIIKPDRIYDIAYVGSNNKQMHQERFELIQKLKDHFPNSYFGSASGKDMYKIYSQSKIVFNKSINNDINMRYFEALGNGAILLTDQIFDNGVEDLFEINKHLLLYDHTNILTVVNSYLEQKHDESYLLADFIDRNHTYDIRVENILEKIKLSKKVKKTINRIDYLKVYLMLQNYFAFILSIKLIITNDIIDGRKKRYLLFFPILLALNINIFILKSIRKRFND